MRHVCDARVAEGVPRLRSERQKAALMRQVVLVRQAEALVQKSELALELTLVLKPPVGRTGRPLAEGPPAEGQKLPEVLARAEAG